jgi:hypothetical protein
MQEETEIEQNKNLVSYPPRSSGSGPKFPTSVVDFFLFLLTISLDLFGFVQPSFPFPDPRFSLQPTRQKETNKSQTKARIIKLKHRNKKENVTSWWCRRKSSFFPPYSSWKLCFLFRFCYVFSHAPLEGKLFTTSESLTRFAVVSL